MHNTTSIEKYFFFALLGITIFLMITILYPFLTILILAAAFTVVLDPIYKWINKYIARGYSTIASFITVLLFVFVLCAPVLFIGSAVIKQTQNAYSSIAAIENHGMFLETLNTSINRVLPEGISIDIGSKVTDLVSFVSGHATGFFTSTFQTIVMFLFMLLALFYLLKDGAEWKKSFMLLCPLSEKNIKDIFTQLQITINQVIKGTFLIAIIQGALMGIGLVIFGVPNATLWAVTTGIASFVPTVGTSLVFIPAALFLYFTGMPLHALGLLIWSFTLVIFIDNFLSPFIISKNTDMPSFFILFAILGGIVLMGPVGILIGPLVLSLLYSLISIYRKEVIR